MILPFFSPDCQALRRLPPKLLCPFLAGLLLWISPRILVAKRVAFGPFLTGPLYGLLESLPADARQSVVGLFRMDCTHELVGRRRWDGQEIFIVRERGNDFYANLVFKREGKNVRLLYWTPFSPSRIPEGARVSREEARGIQELMRRAGQVRGSEPLFWIWPPACCAGRSFGSG
jgi:hypothetical protein